MCKSSAGPYSPILVGIWIFKLQLSFKYPPSKAVNPTTKIPLSFAYSTALIIFLELPDADMQTMLSQGLAKV